MSAPDPFERAAASVLAEPIPASLRADVVERRAEVIRRRHRIVTAAATCVVVLLAGSLALTARRSSGVSVLSEDPAAQATSHTYRYRFAAAPDEATRQATVARLEARYRALGDDVVVDVVSDSELSITDKLPAAQSSHVVEAMTVVGATSLRAVTQDVGVPRPASSRGDTTTPRAPGPDASCAAGSLAQWEPERKLLAGCFVVGDAPAVEAGNDALAAEAKLAATASSGTMEVRLNPALASQFATLQLACSQRGPACPLGTIALVLDQSVAGTAPSGAVVGAPDTITVNGLFNQQVGPWLSAILRTGQLPTPIVAVGSDNRSTAITPSTTTR